MIVVQLPVIAAARSYKSAQTCSHQMPQVSTMTFKYPALRLHRFAAGELDYLTKYQASSLVGVSTRVAVSMAGCASGGRMPSRPLFAAGAVTLESKSAKT